MITIGDFASLGRVSVRMLRHYDAIGLLAPAFVDPHTGYRHYDLDQLRRLNRIVALKELGLGLDTVRRVLDDDLTGDELRAMLRLRQAELAESIRADEHRLARVQARLRLIEQENTMSVTATTVSLPAVRLLGRTAVAVAAVSDEIGPLIQTLYPQVVDALIAAGHPPAGPAVAHYESAPDTSEDALRVCACFPTDALVGHPDAVAGLEVVDVAAGDFASLVHRGGMDTVDETYQLLRRWVTEQEWTLDGRGREIYLEMGDDPADWVTEVLVGFTRS
ncbi:MerR family transcriptional regulator [Williamsia deligens]|uniref:MerR family transcriptional regulator n=1 Tax=Williamsia deligens TaxID=321325 RepID=A0ABW3G462_9NOCA|nr:MerR family transcriptional regulator [Williamsia deligens]MCP2194241.1 DNA-binding transcriptional regulator, MerR family [Williamsia deligens]